LLGQRHGVGPSGHGHLQGLGPQVRGEIKRLAKALVRNMGEKESRAVTHTFQRLAVLLVYDNASMFLTRVPEAVEAITSRAL
jgi:hypothetical protein